MRQTPVFVAAALVLVLAAWPAVGAGPSPALASRIEALAPLVEATAAATRPRHWPMKRACLYYALAGQALLARRGVAAGLRAGRVVYWPGTPAAYPIDPHTWLRSGAYFIDYAALPRWQRVAVIPGHLVAAAPAQVVPGITRVLAVPDALDPQLQRYLQHHHRCFLGRWTARCRDA